LIIEQFASVTQASDMDSCLFEFLIAAGQAIAIAFAGAVSYARYKIEDMEFSRGISEQMSEIRHTFGVL
jgi:hypothetical protein